MTHFENLDAPFIVLCTGCAGHGRDKYIKKLIDEKFPNSKDIRTFRMRDEIYKQAEYDGIQLTDSTVLNMDEDRRAKYREAAIESIIKESRNYKCCLISSPVTFKWKGETIFGLRPSDVTRLNPDLFVTVVSDLLPTQWVLREEDQWKSFDFTLKDLADWREMEIRETRQLARHAKKLVHYYVLPSEHPLDVFFDLIVNPKKKKAYFSYPLTDATAKQITEAQAVMQELKDDFVIFDPWTIKDPILNSELEKELKAAKSKGTTPKKTLTLTLDYPSGTRRLQCRMDEVEQARKSINTQTVRLDHHLIAQGDMVVAYLPFPAAGVVSEMIFAHERAKPVYAFYQKHPSPFLDYACTEIFETVDELVENVKKQASKQT